MANVFELLKVVIAKILPLTIPYIQDLILSKFVPILKRKGYELLDKKANKIIEDLVQNAEKIKDAEGIKKEAYIEGTRLGVATLRAIAEKLNKASDEIEKVLE